MKTIQQYLRDVLVVRGRSRAEHLLACHMRGTPYLAIERVIAGHTQRPEKLHGEIVAMLRAAGVDMATMPPREVWEAWCAGARVKGSDEAAKAQEAERARLQKRAAMHVLVGERLSPGLAAAQALHAARELQKRWPAEEKRWHDTSNTVVIHRAPDPEGLVEELRQLGALVAPFVDRDLGEAITAVAILGVARRAFRSLPLF